jgi:5-methylcytosine-specific restriction endonuclease McrA
MDQSGRCSSCPEPAAPGKTKCARHLILASSYQRKFDKTPKGIKIRQEIRQRPRTDTGKFRVARSKARSRKIEWNLTRSQYLELIVKACHYCRLPFSSKGIGLDRLNNDGGYTIENVVPCCAACNYARGDRFSPEETKLIGETIRQIMLARAKG